jgi:polyhydroxyalkanoate synthesis regulator phasin
MSRPFGSLHALRDFPELQGEMQALINAASEAVSTRRADIEKLADALVERMSLNSDEARQLVGY